MNEFYFFEKVLDTFKKSFIPIVISSITIVLIFSSIIDLSSSNDVTINSKSLLNDDNVQYEIRKTEAKFRELIYKKIDSINLDANLLLIDSLKISSNQTNDIRNYIIFNKLKSEPLDYSITIPINKSTSPLIELKDIITIFEIDYDKLNDILSSTKSNILEDNIKYGNYLKTKYEYKKAPKYEYITIGLFVILALLIFLYYRNRIGKNNNKIEDTVESLITDKEAISLAQEILQDDKIEKKEIEKLKKLVSQIEGNLNKYDFENILDSILYVDMIKSERKSSELYNRSTLMLILGLLIATLGIVIFYLTLPEFKGDKSAVNYLSLTIRPSFILIFIQSIAFYLLRQYRSLINDYKYFYQDYLNKSQNFVTYQLMQNKNLNELEVKLIEKLLTEKFDNNKETYKESEISSNEDLIGLLKSIIEKIK